MNNTIIQCLYCPQKLRVPLSHGALQVKCPSCGKSFRWAPNQSSSEVPQVPSSPFAELNPFNAPLREIITTLTARRQRQNAVADEIRWFNTLSEQQLNNDLVALRNRRGELLQLNEDIQKDIASDERALEHLQSQKRSLVNPVNWFSPDQRQIRHRQQEFIQSKQSKESARLGISSQLNKAEEDIEILSNKLLRYSSFNLAAHTAELGIVQAECESLSLKAKSIAARRDSVDCSLQPIIDQMDSYIKLQQKAEERRDRAAVLDLQLTNAGNSYEKAMVHEKCEKEFGVSSPRKVISDAERELRRISTDYEKARVRAVEVGKKASRRIDAIIVDGNNLCYESSRFIGLSALCAILPLLRRTYDVTVVFDAAIRRMLSADDKAISAKLGNGVTVHIVAALGKADESILDLASSKQNTYILSNDRFGEYGDKRAIKESRIIRHEIVGGRVMVNDLGINVEYISS